MNAPARKVDQCLSELADPLQPLSELQLRAILNDCKRTLSQVSSYEAAPLYNAMAIAAERLGLFPDAHRYAQRALNLDPNNTFLKANLAAALADIGQYDDAMDIFASLSGTDVPEYLLLANMAECLARVGLTEDAQQALQDAVNVADLSDPRVLFVLAQQAALVGAEETSLELLARAVACVTKTSLGDETPLEVIASAPDSLRQAIEEKRSLQLALARARAFAGIPHTEPLRTFAECEQADDVTEVATRDAMEMFGATKPMRARATQAVLFGANRDRS